jgi:fatty-acid peroxygenase
MHTEAMSRLGEMFAEEWTGMLEAMPGPRRIVLHGFAREVLTRTACRWAGVPAAATDERAISSELGMMIDNVAKVGPANWMAQLRRRGTERWAAGLIEDVRDGRFDPGEGTALAVFSHHTDARGERMTAEGGGRIRSGALRPGGPSLLPVLPRGSGTGPGAIHLARAPLRP